MSAAASLTTHIADYERACADLDSQGYCIIPNVLSPSEVGELRSRLVAQAAGERASGVAFHDGGPSQPNQRVFMLMNKGKVFRDLMLHPIVGALIGHLLGADFLVSSFTANVAYPGGEPMALHTDQGYVGFWTPVPAAANIAWMLDDFSDVNGGTRLVPASHLNQLTPSPLYTSSSVYAPKQLANMPTLADTIAAEGSAGSILCFDARLWHGTGANRTNLPRHALFSYFCRPFLRQQENFTLGFDPELIRTERPALLERLGFATWSGLGRVENPRPATPLYIDTGRVGPLAAEGAPANA